jgi:hypothetical protein
VDTAVRLLPTATLLSAGLALAWFERGSIAAAHWLPYAITAALVLATAVVFGAAFHPPRGALIALAALLGLAVWAAISIAWSPARSLARDEALLTAFYALAFATPLLTLRTAFDRAAATAVVAGGLVLLVLATGAALALAPDPDRMFFGGRLVYPVSYANAQAALTLIGFWPAVALAARRGVAAPLRALACGGAAALLAGWLVTQSKGAGIALAASALVVFALCPGRLRLLLPVAIAAAVAGAAASPLTGAFRTTGVRAIERAGLAVLVVFAVAAGIGLAYAAADRRVHVTPRLRHAIGVVVLAALAVGVGGATVAFAVRVDDPRGYVDRKWEAFASLPEHREEGATHFTSLGSNRYDFWRVSLDEFQRHPIRGGGARSFRAAYLEHGRSHETPVRAHSLPLEVLAELGLIGFVLLALAVGLPLAVAARRLPMLPALAAFGAGVFWLVHAAADWIWTVPATGLVFFLLLGIGCTGERTGAALSRAARWPAGAVLLALALLAFAPPWLSSRLTTRVLEHSSPDVAADLARARRLDPLSVAPLTAEAGVADTPSEAIPPLERAAELEPRSAGVQYLLGLAYLEAGRKQAARERLRLAHSLYPRGDVIMQALRRAR